MIDLEIWNSIIANEKLTAIAPSWVRPILEMPFAEVLKLAPPEDTPATDCVLQPTLELKEITIGYLEFLREHIRLDARGKEWTKVLEARLNAFAPFAGKKLYFVSVLRVREGQIETFFVRFRPEDFQIVHFECQ